MRLVRLRVITDILTCVILIICMTILPIFIFMTYTFNTEINEQMHNIDNMFVTLEESHNLNAKLIFETLEFRKIEYRGYLTKEAPDFLYIMDNTLKNYIEYINQDLSLSADEKQKLMVEVEKIKIAVEARRHLTERLANYDNNREFYLNNINTNKRNNHLNKFKKIYK